jgi:RNA polymerase sigma factor (sigma-70 family)
MVFGVCRRVVRNPHDAEDAFQATFLILARKASSVKQRERVANWLHGVALRTAMKAKTMIAKRRGREKQVTVMPEPEAAPQGQWPDLQPLLDQELNGLPENYRLPILLCALQGKTIKEAAQQLGWLRGTRAGRLARGRQLLAKRLANRGVVVSAGSLAVVVSQNVASAGVPTLLMSSTVEAATMIAAGQTATAGVISVNVAALTEGVLKAMMVSKVKVVTVVLLAVVCIGGTGTFLLPAVGQPPPAEKKDENTKAAAGERRQKETDKAKLQGRWEIVSIAEQGLVFKKKDNPDELKDIDLEDVVIKGDRLQPTKADDINSCWHGRFTLDDSRDPKQITLRKKGPDGDVIYRGIYSIEGDVFQMCINTDDTDVSRPEEFVTKKGSRVAMITFKKVTTKK